MDAVVTISQDDCGVSKPAFCASKTDIVSDRRCEPRHVMLAVLGNQVECIVSIAECAKIDPVRKLLVVVENGVKADIWEGSA